MHKRAKVTAAFVNNVSKLGKPKLNRIFCKAIPSTITEEYFYTSIVARTKLIQHTHMKVRPQCSIIQTNAVRPEHHISKRSEQ